MTCLRSRERQVDEGMDDILPEIERGKVWQYEQECASNQDKSILTAQGKSKTSRLKSSQ